MTEPNLYRNATLFGEAVWYFSAFVIFTISGKFYPPGELPSIRFYRYNKYENAPAGWHQNRGVANPNRKIKAGTIIIQCLAEKGKEKIK